MTWDPEVEQRPHPFGEAGVRSSLEEVCKRAAKGASEILGDGKKLSRVRAWAGDQLIEARKRGETVHRAEDRARILLRAVQEKKLWVPDPIGMEHIVAARHTACDDHDENGVCVKIGDCDDQCVLLAACFMAVGLYTMIVGHSYTRDNVIGHVLTKVYFNGKWHYADPSPLGNGKYLPLGKSAPYTRERYYSLPTIKVVCDAASCDVRNFDPLELGFVEKGTFVGVNGIVVEEMPPPTGRVQWLGEVEWLGGEDKNVVQQIAEDCTNVKSADFDTKTGREQAFKSSAKCTAETACAIYSKGAIPPGVCGTVAGPIVDTAISVWNSVFGDNEEAERARIRDANTAKFFQELDRLFAADAAWSAYVQNTMTRLIKFHDKNLPWRQGAWGGGTLVKDKIQHADITKPGVPVEYQSWDVERFSNPCPVFKKLVALDGLPTKKPSVAGLCDGLSVKGLHDAYLELPPGSSVQKAENVKKVLNSTLPQWMWKLSRAANKLEAEVVVEATRRKVEGGETSAGFGASSPSSPAKTAVTVGAVAGAGWLAVKYLLPYLSKVVR